MSCNPALNYNIRKLFLECQTSILDSYSIPENKRTVIESVSYLILPIDPRDYTRTEGTKTSFRESFKNPFIFPRLTKVGFTARITDNFLNVKQCIEFVAFSSISTSYSDNFIPVTILDNVRPELTDEVYTVRKGLLTIEAGNGYSGSDVSQKPLYVEDYTIVFEEVNKRLVA